MFHGRWYVLFTLDCAVSTPTIKKSVTHEIFNRNLATDYCELNLKLSELFFPSQLEQRKESRRSSGENFEGSVGVLL